MTPISQTSERPIHIIHVQDQTKSVYTSAKNELWQIQLDLPQLIIEIKYFNIQKMFPLSKALEMSLKFICLHPKPENDILFSCSCTVSLFSFVSSVFQTY